MNVKTIGIDLAKEVFQIYGVDVHGKRLFNKQLRRAQMTSFFANIPPCLIGMEVCASAHLSEKMTDRRSCYLNPIYSAKPAFSRNSDGSTGLYPAIFTTNR